MGDQCEDCGEVSEWVMLDEPYAAMLCDDCLIIRLDTEGE